MVNQNYRQPLPKIQPASPNPGSKKTIWILLSILIVLILVFIGIYFGLPKEEQNTVKETVNKTVEDVYKPKVAFASRFATYEEVAVNIKPKVPAYTVESNLANITNASDFTFSNNFKDLLVKNAFAVEPGNNKEFFPLYESNRYAYTPNFITTDSMLHNYHLMFDFILKQLEEQKLSAEMKKLSSSMLTESLDQYEKLKGTEWENAAKRTVGFFAVGSKLIDSSSNTPEVVKTEVDKELALINAHQGIEVSPLMNIGAERNDLENLKEDYSQYVPRGHYDKTDQLKAYFNSMMWYGRLTFRLKNEDEVKSALLISLALNKEENNTSWDNIYEPVNFFVGKSDDITYYDFKDLIENVYGENPTLQTVSTDTSKLTSFISKTKTLDPPQINSIPIFNSGIQPDREAEIKGFRFMGQRFTIDASIFQRLIDRETPKRMLPKGLDIPAAMGSKEALSILTDLEETKYDNYSENMSKMQTYLSGLETEKWTQNLYWGWLYQLRPLLDVKGEGYPTFMQNKAWVRKDINTYLGSWSELKHDTILYAKQVYSELGAGEPESKDDRGYVEPNPYVFARLASLLKMTNSGLAERSLLTESMKGNLTKMEELALSLKTIAEKELNDENLTDAEYELIRSYGGQLEHFWLEVNKDEPSFKEMNNQTNYLNENPAAIVADVATDPNGHVLEEGTGYISSIYVVVPVEGKLRIAKGGVYSYYEFTQPITERLTDKKWREMLDAGQAPDLPTWTKEFVAERTE